MASVADFSDSQVKTVAAAEVLGAVGLILPALLDIAPSLVPIAAAGLSAGRPGYGGSRGCLVSRASNARIGAAERVDEVPILAQAAADNARELTRLQIARLLLRPKPAHFGNPSPSAGWSQRVFDPLIEQLFGVGGPTPHRTTRIEPSPAPLERWFIAA